MKLRDDEQGTKADLIRYRIETAQDDVHSASLLLEAGEFKGANNRAYYIHGHWEEGFPKRRKYAMPVTMMIFI